MKKQLAVLIPTLFLNTLAGGCSSSKDPELTLKLSEYKMVPSTQTVDAGKVTVKANNVGGATHEFVIFAVADPKTLPTKPDGSVDEDAVPKSEKMGELEVEALRTATKTFDLKPGTYSFVCNVVDSISKLAHYKEGMYTTILVK
jgi:plastocyanin